jgi:hypothetical protein
MLITFPTYGEYRTCPYYWHDDKTGVLRRSIDYYRRQICGNPPSLDSLYHQEQLEVLRLYFENYISAPCWINKDFSGEIDMLKDIIKRCRTVEELYNWHQMSIQLEVDPLWVISKK